MKATRSLLPLLIFFSLACVLLLAVASNPASGSPSTLASTSTPETTELPREIQVFCMNGSTKVYFAGNTFDCGNVLFTPLPTIFQNGSIFLAGKQIPAYEDNAFRLHFGIPLWIIHSNVSTSRVLFSLEDKKYYFASCDDNGVVRLHIYDGEWNDIEVRIDTNNEKMVAFVILPFYIVTVKQVGQTFRNGVVYLIDLHENSIEVCPLSNLEPLPFTLNGVQYEIRAISDNLVGLTVIGNIPIGLYLGCDISRNVWKYVELVNPKTNNHIQFTGVSNWFTANIEIDLGANVFLLKYVNNTVYKICTGLYYGFDNCFAYSLPLADSVRIEDDALVVTNPLFAEFFIKHEKLHVTLGNYTFYSGALLFPLPKVTVQTITHYTAPLIVQSDRATTYRVKTLTGEVVKEGWLKAGTNTIYLPPGWYLFETPVGSQLVAVSGFILDLIRSNLPSYVFYVWNKNLDFIMTGVMFIVGLTVAFKRISLLLLIPVLLIAIPVWDFISISSLLALI